MEAGEISYQQTVVAPILAGAGWNGHGMAEAISYSTFVPKYRYLRVLEMGKSRLLGQLGKVKLEKKGYLKSDEQKLNLGVFKPSQKSVESSKIERMGAL